jgi:hypothetical protein
MFADMSRLFLVLFLSVVNAGQSSAEISRLLFFPIINFGNSGDFGNPV